MGLDAALSYLHLLAILSWVVFLSSTAALARAEWLNAAAVERLVVVDRIAGIACLLVLATGAARVLGSAKGAAWLLAQPLLWAKVLLWLLMAVAAWQTRRQIAQWRRLSAEGGMPDAVAIAELRRRVMRAAHLMLVIPLLAVLLARGIGVR